MVLAIKGVRETLPNLASLPIVFNHILFVVFRVSEFSHKGREGGMQAVSCYTRIQERLVIYWLHQLQRKHFSLVNPNITLFLLLKQRFRFIHSTVQISAPHFIYTPGELVSKIGTNIMWNNLHIIAMVCVLLSQRTLVLLATLSAFTISTAVSMDVAMCPSVLGCVSRQAITRRNWLIREPGTQLVILP